MMDLPIDPPPDTGPAPTPCPECGLPISDGCECERISKETEIRFFDGVESDG